MCISFIRFSLLLMLGGTMAACSNTGKQEEPSSRGSATRPWWVRTTRMLLGISGRAVEKILVLLNFRDHDVKVNPGVE